MSALQDLPWQDIVASLIGVGALVHVARRWWPKNAGASAAGCGSCDSGCGATNTDHRPVCDPSDAVPAQRHAHRVIPITPQTPRH
jgi:hypothetical protein